MIPDEYQRYLLQYQMATGQNEDEARESLSIIGLEEWFTNPRYEPERICGRVRTVIRGKAN
jgi:hypothetical protein